jgi:hypothetical protein
MKLVASEDRPPEQPATAAPRGVLARVWVGFKELWWESMPLWFPLLSVAIAIIACRYFDQTIGILQALVDQSEEPHDVTDIALSNAQRFHYWAFIASLCLWCFVNYQATLLLHRFDYNSPEYNGRLSDRSGWLGWVFKQLEWLSPILAGLGPIAVVALAFRFLQVRYDAAQWGLTPQAAIMYYAPLAVVALLVFWRPFGAAQRKTQSHFRPLNSSLTRAEVRLICLMLALIFFLVAAAAWSPESWSSIGPAATLCLAAATFVIVGSIIVFFGGRWRIPLVFLTLLYCIIISPCNDNHAVRITRDSNAPGMPPAPGVLDQLRIWMAQLSPTDPNRKPQQKTPLFIICAEGGGLRAAYWTARVLAYLEDTTRQYPDQYVPFSSRVLAISGVSGGSLGAATFDALLDAQWNHPQNTGDWFHHRVANFLGRDQLSGPLAAAAFVDTTQRFFPFHLFNQRDRAAGLERAWERAWDKSIESAEPDTSRFCHFSDDFRTLWRHRDGPKRSDGLPNPWIPSLFFNGTSVELGGRIIVSDCGISAGDYPGAQDAFCLLKLRPPGKDKRGTGKVEEPAKLEPGLFRLSSAVNLSTRFPGISPSGELPAPEGQFSQRVVDGGYYDNSGARTAWDNLVPVYYELLNRMVGTDHPREVVPWIIIIRAGPLTKRQTPSFKVNRPEGWGFLPAPVRPVRQHFMVDLLAPARAFFNAWGSRSGDSAEALKDGAYLISRRLAGQEEEENEWSKPPTNFVEDVPPLERVDYSAPHRGKLLNDKAPDPYVIELNLELDEQDLQSTDQRKHKLLLPLGWMLPAKARDVMESELKDRLAPKPDVLNATTHDEEWFRKLQSSQLGRVLSLLHHERPIKKTPDIVVQTAAPVTQ